ncbi:MAG TPA: response regulator [Candidatus Limnocylindrales bacterium]|nr:response regulator [Candidatus Limnocylindrales bacterium]
MGNNCVILVAEDNPADTILLKRALSGAKIRLPAIFFDDGQQIIDYLKQYRPTAKLEKENSPALIMVDLAMPKVGGLEVLAWVRQQPDLSQLPVIVFSGLNRPIDISRAYALGADLFLIKTADPNQWTTVLQRVAEIYHLLEPDSSSASPPIAEVTKQVVDEGGR